MIHDPEFRPQTDHSRREAAADALAQHYRETFEANESGKVVWEDLQRKFSMHRSRFTSGGSTVTAALIDGECNVIREITNALKRGSSPFPK
jgi:hypothetical protein